MSWFKQKTTFVSTGVAAFALSAMALTGGAVAFGLGSAPAIANAAGHAIPMCGSASPCNQ